MASARVESAGEPMTSARTTTLTRRGLIAGGIGTGATLFIPAAASAATLPYSFQAQETGSWCSAASTRIALTARDVTPSQSTLANDLGLSGGAGLQDPTYIAAVLNAHLLRTDSAQKYRFRMPAAGTLAKTLHGHTRTSIDAGYPVVINMNQVAGDTFNAGHYVTIVGYTASRYQLADPFTSARNGVWYPHADVVAWNKLNRYTAFA